MAAQEVDINMVFQNLTIQLASLAKTVGAQAISQVVNPYNGDPKSFKGWVKNIEKFALLTNATDERVKLIAYQSSIGPVGDFIHRYLKDHPQNTWPQLRAELTSRFAECTDPQLALQLLRKVKQQPGEGVQMFAERLLTLAEDAFNDPNAQAQDVIEQQLVGFFIDGLCYDNLKMRIMRENPNRFQAAVLAAMQEQNLRKRFNLRTGRFSERTEEPMDVDHIRPKRCFKCSKTGHLARTCRVQVNSADCRYPQIANRGRNPRETDRPQFPAYAPEGNAFANRPPYPMRYSPPMREQLPPPPSNQTICWNCHHRGHISRNCPDWNRQQPPSARNNRSGQKPGN